MNAIQEQGSNIRVKNFHHSLGGQCRNFELNEKERDASTSLKHYFIDMGGERKLGGESEAEVFEGGNTRDRSLVEEEVSGVWKASLMKYHKLGLRVIYYQIIFVAVNKHRVHRELKIIKSVTNSCLLYTSPSPRDLSTSRMPSSA